MAIFNQLRLSLSSLTLAFAVIFFLAISSPSALAVSTSPPTFGGVKLGLGYTGTPFGPNFWGQALPSNTPLNPNSATYVNTILSSLAQAAKTSPCTANGYLETTGAPPIYVVPANYPTVPVTISPDAHNSVYDASWLQQNVLAGGIPIPTWAQPATNNTDHTLIIYQPSTDTLWEMWKVFDTNGNWTLWWGGKMTGVLKSNGIWPVLGPSPATKGYIVEEGTSATGDALTGVVNRVEELQAGEIDHPVDLELSNSIVLNKKTLPANTPGASQPYSWPADRLPDGSSSNPLDIPEGLRFRINPNLNINSLKLTPVARTLALAGQKYGFIVENTGPGPGLDIKIGNPNPYLEAGLADPDIALFGSDYGSCYSPKIMANFPWSSLQALPYNYGQNGMTAGGSSNGPVASGGPSVINGGTITANGIVNITDPEAAPNSDSTIIIDGQTIGSLRGNSVTTSTATLTNGLHEVTLRSVGPNGKIVIFSETVNVKNSLLRQILANYVNRPLPSWVITGLLVVILILAYTFGWFHIIARRTLALVSAPWYRYKTKDFVSFKQDGPPVLPTETGRTIPTPDQAVLPDNSSEKKPDNEIKPSS